MIAPQCEKATEAALSVLTTTADTPDDVENMTEGFSHDHERDNECSNRFRRGRECR